MRSKTNWNDCRMISKLLFSNLSILLEHKTRKFTNDMDMELENSEVLIAAEQTGSFAFWEDPSEDIYSLSDGVPL